MPSYSRSPSPARPRSPSRSRSRSPSPNPQAEACPILIRVFITKGRHTPLVDFDDGRWPERDEFQVYGWKHSTPTSIIQQLYSVFPAPYRSPLARYAFKHVFVDVSDRGLYRGEDMVSFSGRDFVSTVQPDRANGLGNGNGNGHGAGEREGSGLMDRELDDAAPRRGQVVEEKTLDAYGFITGDLLSVAITVPEPRPLAINGAARGSAAADWRGRAPPADFARDRDRDYARGREGPGAGVWERGAVLPPRGGDRQRPQPPPSARGGGPRRASPDWGRGRSRSRSPRRDEWRRRD